jgi:hypothetical protein
MWKRRDGFYRLETGMPAGLIVEVHPIEMTDDGIPLTWSFRITHGVNKIVPAKAWRTVASAKRNAEDAVWNREWWKRLQFTYTELN